MEITRLKEVIEGLTGAPSRHLGRIDHVRSECGLLYVYSERESADLGALISVPHYITSDLDLWCWRGPLPDWECASGAGPFRLIWTAKSPWGFEEFLEREPRPELERHSFRIFERFHKLADILFNPAFQHSAANRRALEQVPEVSLDEWNVFVTGILSNAYPEVA